MREAIRDRRGADEDVEDVWGAGEEGFGVSSSMTPIFVLMEVKVYRMGAKASGPFSRRR
ncbi:MAG TPA: hypothetical protein PLM24_09560 [Methanothrix sp.]|nr:hypothetical protein [Methanothrix sp.]HPR67366.1 hypothetical protein [Methanothrix sp.]